MIVQIEWADQKRYDTNPSEWKIHILDKNEKLVIYLGNLIIEGIITHENYILCFVVFNFKAKRNDFEVSTDLDNLSNRQKVQIYNRLKEQWENRDECYVVKNLRLCNLQTTTKTS